MNLANLLNTNAERFPMRPAIGFKKKDEWKEINWKLLRTMVFKTATALRNAGVKDGDRVAIFSENSAEWITFDLAVLALGAVTVPVYSTNTREQAEFVLKDSGARILLAGGQEQYDAAHEILENGGLDLIIVSKKSVWIKKEKSVYLEDFIENFSDDFELVPKNENDVATLIYTSGTTGVPKGVMLTHGNFLSVFDAHFDYFKFKNFENEHSLAFLPLTHVFERSWTLLCLYGGAKVSFVENPKLIANALTEVRPTMMCSVPRFYQKIYAGINETIAGGSSTKQKIFASAMKTGAEVAELKRVGKAVPPLLKLKNSLANTLVFSKIKNKLGGKLWFMPCGGAAISPEITKFFDAMGIHLTVGYGLTETTATLTAFPVKNYVYGTAGQAFGDTKIKIGDNDEILAKGPGIMLGYYQNPAETLKVFTEDGWFKTGDAGKLDAAGNLIITDRIKDLMKTSNGKYITPQLIENTLSGNEFISQAVAVAEGRPFVTALIVPEFDKLKSVLENLKIPFTSWQEIMNNKTVIDFYHQKINEYQKNLAGVEKVKKFILMPADFEISSGEITPTLKVRRNIVLAKYADLIEKMYQH